VSKWTEREYTKGEIERAGKVLADPHATGASRSAAVVIVNNWRSAHGFPLNTLTVSLRNRSSAVDPSVLVAQRIKRLPSIEKKLQRYPSMNAARMQDLGGCRAVLAGIREVRAVELAFLSAQHKHKLARHDDYITSPKPSGYRGVHLVYQYQSDRKSTYNGLSIEVQIRSQLMHAWATAVETVGLFTSQALKSSLGDAEWLQFFQLMSSVIANREKSPTVPSTPTTLEELRESVEPLVGELGVLDRLRGYAQALSLSQEHVDERARFVIMALNVEEHTLSITGYRTQDEASDNYAVLEEDSRGKPIDVVLVSASSIAGLRSAYPNYFLDTDVFSRIVDETVRA
jgi:hypothetical protein